MKPDVTIVGAHSVIHYQCPHCGQNTVFKTTVFIELMGVEQAATLCGECNLPNKVSNLHKKPQVIKSACTQPIQRVIDFLWPK
jgi:transcription elongation factor Elf1